MKCGFISRCICLLSLTAGWLTLDLHGAVVTRGPFLQIATPDSITICWRTDVSTSGTVRYGAQPNDLSFSTDEAATNTDHAVRLSGLTPATTYYYSIGTPQETLAKGPDCQFVTAPIPGQAHPTRIWVIGDSGVFDTGYGDVVSVRKAYYDYTRKRRTDVWLALGDNAYLSGTDLEYQHNFFDVFAWLLRQTPVWPTIGNHETYAVPVGQRFPYLDIFTLPTAGEAGGVPSGTENYYSFDHANIHFVCLDSMTPDRSTNGPMANWLRADLAATTSQWIIAYWHHPPYSMGSHNSDWEVELIEMRQTFGPILEAKGVDLVFSGHSHNYERSFLLRGHYGKSTTLQPEMILDRGSGREQETGAYIKPVSGPLANQGTLYVVAGNGGAAESRDGHHPVMFTDEMQLGSVVVDINSNRLDLVFLRETGAIDDSFTIIKADPEPLRMVTFMLRNGQTIARWKSLRGKTYVVERTDTLVGSAWLPAGDPITATGATTFWTNTVPKSADRYFYRVSQQPSTIPHSTNGSSSSQMVQ